MELPQSLLDRCRVGKPAPRKRAERTPMYRTFPAVATFDTGERLQMQVSVRNKPYWAGQLEDGFMRRWNSDPRNAHKIVKVKIFRNSADGGILVDWRRGRVISVN